MIFRRVKSTHLNFQIIVFNLKILKEIRDIYRKKPSRHHGPGWTFFFYYSGCRGRLYPRIPKFEDITSRDNNNDRSGHGKIGFLPQIYFVAGISNIPPFNCAPPLYYENAPEIRSGVTLKEQRKRKRTMNANALYFKRTVFPSLCLMMFPLFPPFHF